MKPLKSILAALAISTPLNADAVVTEPVAETAVYRAYVGGLPLGNLTLNVAMDADGYAVQAQFDMTALLRVILDTDARVQANGDWRNGEARPTRFAYWVRDGKKNRNTEMRFNKAGDPVEVVADPPFRKKSYAMSIDQAAGAVDPASAVAMLTAPRTRACDLDMSVFDGAKLHRIALDPNEQPVGSRVRCKGRYERVAGFKAKYMKPELRSYEFVAELKLVAPNRWQPTKVWARTKFGMATAVLQ